MGRASSDAAQCFRRVDNKGRISNLNFSFFITLFVLPCTSQYLQVQVLKLMSCYQNFKFRKEGGLVGKRLQVFCELNETFLDML